MTKKIINTYTEGMKKPKNPLFDPEKKLSENLTFQFQFAVDNEDVKALIPLCYDHNPREAWGRFSEARIGADKRTTFHMTVETLVELHSRRQGVSREMADVRAFIRIMSMR